MNIDDKEYFNLPLSDELKTKAFQNEFYLYISLAVGKDIINESDSPTSFEMVIDYITIEKVDESPNFKYLKNLVFFDDFDGDQLNTTKWTYNIGVGINGWGTSQKQYYTNRSENLYLKNSKLYIRALRGFYKNRLYTSSKITTENSLNFRYGIIQANISFPSVKGIASGLWLFSTYNNNVWTTGEIDALVAVYNSTDDTTLSSGCQWGKKKTYYKSGKYDITKFNEYTIYWDKHYIIVYIDDLEIYKIDINSEGFEAFHNPFFLNLNVLVGGNTVEYPIDIDAFPLEMIIDYIKVYNFNISKFKYNKNIKENYNSSDLPSSNNNVMNSSNLPLNINISYTFALPTNTNIDNSSDFLVRIYLIFLLLLIIY
jgi:beta-glucanase (GH16 family)